MFSISFHQGLGKQVLALCKAPSSGHRTCYASTRPCSDNLILDWSGRMTDGSQGRRCGNLMDAPLTLPPTPHIPRSPPLKAPYAPRWSCPSPVTPPPIALLPHTPRHTMLQRTPCTDPLLLLLPPAHSSSKRPLRPLPPHTPHCSLPPLPYFPLHLPQRAPRHVPVLHSSDEAPDINEPLSHHSFREQTLKRSLRLFKDAENEERLPSTSLAPLRCSASFQQIPKPFSGHCGMFINFVPSHTAPECFPMTLHHWGFSSTAM